MLELLITLIVLGFVLWLVTLVPMPQPYKQILLGLAVLFVVIWLLTALLGGAHGVRLPGLR